jgi:molybdopterin-dependent oxidoreductase alpha subunit
MAGDKVAGGLGAIWTGLRHASRAGLSRMLPALTRVNQKHGFDCPGCAWPERSNRALIECCENGVKAIAHEMSEARLTREFFSHWSIPALLERSDQWLEQQGRIAEPMILRPGAVRYEPIPWNTAFHRIGEILRLLESPQEAVFYSSGRTSNEAAFLYQLFARQFGTSNLCSSSHFCDESGRAGLAEVIGFGQGTVRPEDFEQADLILVLGQNPGTSHPRMLNTLARAVKRGCRVISINPLRERGLVRWRPPGNPFAGATALAERFVRVRIGGDIALIKGILKEVLALENSRPGTVLDRDFIDRHSEGFQELRQALADWSFEELVEQSGVPREEIGEIAEIYIASERVIACWATGLNQHRHGAENIQELANLLMLRGNLGKPGAGLCPLQGHSNAQGVRAMGVAAKPDRAFLQRLGREFEFTAPIEPGYDGVEAIHAMHDGKVQAFIGLGGNFAAASPDTDYTAQGLRRCHLTVQIATRLNRSHLITGQEAILLPCLCRSERDRQASGDQFVSVESSMGAIHRSQGQRDPASAEVRSEPAIVGAMARATLGDATEVPWEKLIADYERIRERISRVIPGFENANERIRASGGFVLPSVLRDRKFATPSGRARFRVVPLPEIELAEGQLLLTTVRSHDQFNTTVYGNGDRYRGIKGGRRVVLLNRADMEERGIAEGQRVDLTSRLEGQTRSISGLSAVAYDVPVGCAVSYFPEANPLVPIDHFAPGSGTPAYKLLPVSLAPTTTEDEDAEMVVS